MIGSHTDTVRCGGRFDGTVGVLGAIELVRSVREAGITLNRDLIVVDLLGEDTTGLASAASEVVRPPGQLSAAELNRPDATRSTLASIRTVRTSAQPSSRDDWARHQRIHHYIELYIEQGPILEHRRSEIGVVTAIAGFERLFARFTGPAGHTGTMPMDDRRDALVAAAEAVLAVRREGCGLRSTVLRPPLRFTRSLDPAT